MKTSVIVTCLLVGVASAFPQQQKYQQQQYQQQPQEQYQQQAQTSKVVNPPVPIVAYENSLNYDGSFKYSFEGGDGTRATQEGNLKSFGKEAGEVSQGSYSYVGDDGKTYSVQYIADENGYRAVGDHLPQSPPIPDAIQKSLDFLATAPPQPAENNQQYGQQQQYSQQQYNQQQ